MKRTFCMIILSTTLGLGGCAHSGAPTSTAATSKLTAQPAIILSVRPTSVPNDSAPWRLAFIADADASMTASDHGKSAMMEFILRADDGATISIIQSNELNLQPGDRVLIQHDTSAHLSRGNST